MMMFRAAVACLALAGLGCAFSITHHRDLGDVIYSVASGQESLDGALRPAPAPQVTIYCGGGHC